MSGLQLQSGLGLLALTALCWALGGFARPPWRLLLAGLGGQIVLGAALLHLPFVRAGFSAIGRGVDALATATRAGTTLVFGFLGGGPLPFALMQPGADFVLFFQALPLILVMGALSAVLYHWRVLPLVVGGLSRVLRAGFGLSGAAGLSVAANVFLGMVEAPLLIRPWLAGLSRSELFVVMVAGLATISGNMLVVYASMIASVVPDAAGQLLAASLISAPAAVLVAGLMVPGMAASREAAEPMPPRLYDSTLDAVLKGIGDGLSLMLGIMAALIVFVALVALGNMVLEPLTGMSLEGIAAWVFRPLALAMGVPWAESGIVAASLGTKIVVNEFVAYLEMATSGGLGLSERSRLILTYALCGFTNFASLGIMLAGMGGMCPERRADIIALGPRSLLGAALACCMTGAVVGVLTAP
ncbi:CNT family concentrative nucleoside transporter [Humitalea rosea]|uniref:CNT family concentrative nucleoside transporter n=1 Tax=Humitalea rosea TaxID=990373 RepID=A0A2W7IJI0_9PROT|nr:nucleoside transporter C-terminal domain-containing protein [Humitalea rosea]PZW47089.1 CNT family concentrative nucleoside transporter [Humitalea rosea]